MPIFGGLMIGLWCLGWLLALMASTLGLPGLLSMQGRAGAFDLLGAATLPTHGGLLLAAMWLTMIAASALLLALARWLDRDGTSFDSIRWALSSRAWNGLYLLVIAACVILGITLPQWPWWLISIPIMLVMPFVLLNPVHLTLPQPPPRLRWYWPGLAALTFSLMLWLVSIALNMGADFISQGDWTAGVASIALLTLAETFLLWMMLGRWLQLNGFAINRRSLSALMAQTLTLTLMFFASHAPLIMIAAMNIFVIPGYAYWADNEGHSLPWSIQAITALGGSSSDNLPLLVLPFVAIWMQATGRLRLQLEVENQRD